MNFYTEDISNGYNWKSLDRAIARMMEHIGWKDINVIGGAGDKGGDVLATRAEGSQVKSWAVQSKAVTGGYIGPQALNEAINAPSFYDTNIAAVATNGEFTRTARQRQEQSAANGYTLKLWNGAFLKTLIRVTHSRRIFVQQLGRGLRLSAGKENVIVLDFVSDIRRMAEMLEMNNEGRIKGAEREIEYISKERIRTYIKDCVLNAYTKAFTKKVLAASTPEKVIRDIYGESASVIQNGTGKQSELFVLRSEAEKFMLLVGELSLNGRQPCAEPWTSSLMS